MVETTIPSLHLRDGIEVPQLALGALYLLPGDTRWLVELALEAGYRHVDIVAGHGNEEGVGEALAASGLPREDYFVAAKLQDATASRDSTLAAFETVLARLDLDHVDLLLLDRREAAEVATAWQALEEVHREEAARTIGVANFGIGDFGRLAEVADTPPTVNQVELHPWLQRADLRAWHAEHGIATEAWSPLAQGALLDDPAVVQIAEDLNRTPAQVALRWHVQLGNVAIPKSVTAERIRELTGAFDFELSGSEMAAMAGLERGIHIGPDTAEMALP
jgi:diketogulonate reductase-like aldo/keto reductase